MFYSIVNDEIADLKELDQNFDLTLPFREVDLALDSPVRLFFQVFFPQSAVMESSLFIAGTPENSPNNP